MMRERPFALIAKMAKRVVSEHAIASLLRYRLLKAHYREDSIGGQMTHKELAAWITRSGGHSKREAKWMYQQSRYIDQRGWDAWWNSTRGPLGYKD